MIQPKTSFKTRNCLSQFYVPAANQTAIKQQQLFNCMRVTFSEIIDFAYANLINQNQITCNPTFFFFFFVLVQDWLPERVRWSYLHRSRLPAVSREKNLPESHIINLSLSKLVRSRLLDIGFVIFSRVYRTWTPPWSINTQERSKPHTWTMTHIHI